MLGHYTWGTRWRDIFQENGPFTLSTASIIVYTRTGLFTWTIPPPTTSPCISHQLTSNAAGARAFRRVREELGNSFCLISLSFRQKRRFTHRARTPSTKSSRTASVFPSRLHAGCEAEGKAACKRPRPAAFAFLPSRERHQRVCRAAWSCCDGSPKRHNE